MSDIARWLKQLGLSQYEAAFKQNAIDWELLPDVDQETLKDIGVNAAGHRLRILKAIADLGPEQTTTPSPVAEAPTVESATLPGADDDRSTWSRTPGERKPVTMLFADIAGSTAMTERLDPEEAHDLLYGATRVMCDAIEASGGTVCRFMGDGVMAMFGAPVASERHALEACRAALEMQSGVEKYAAKLIAAHGVEIQIRIGLHSGEVVVLEVGADPQHPEYDASGPTVPLAARTEQAASPGSVLVSDATRALAGESIVVRAHAPVTVKGISEPVEVHELCGIRPALEATGTGRSPFVGRRAELAQYRGLLESCIEEGEGRTVFVRGEAGIGKSRLVEEFMRLAWERAFDCHKGLVLDFGVGKGQDAVRTLARSFLGIAPGSRKGERRAALEAAEACGLTNEEQRVYLNDLLDLPQPVALAGLYDAMENAARNEGKREVMRHLIRRLAVRRPLLVVVENVHWADSITLHHLAAWTTVVGGSPAVLVLTSRIEGDPLDAEWRARADDSPLVTFDVGPLKADESVALVGAFIDSGDALAKRCIERAAGNPLFLEQLMRGVGESAEESIPDSIQSLVLARLDHLRAPDKIALRAAAVIGQRFELGALRELIGDPGYDCTGLVDHHLVRPEAQDYLFAHSLIRDCVYASLLKRQRRELHLKIAGWFAASDLVLHAEHLDRAGDPKAPRAYLAAARDQANQHRIERALRLVNRAIETAPTSDHFDPKCLQGELLRGLGSIHESIAAYRDAAAAAADEVERCRACIGVAEGLRIAEEHDELVAVLDDAAAIARDRELFAELARIHQLRGTVYFMRGEFDDCFAANTTSLEHARHVDSPEIEAQALSGMGDAEYARGRMASAYRHFDRCIALADEHGIGRIVAANLSLRGKTHFWRNDLAAAVDDCRAAADLAARIRNQRAEMIALEAGAFLVDMGDSMRGREWLEGRLAIARRLGARVFEAGTLLHLAYIMVLEGDRLEAERIACEALAALRESGSGMSFWGPFGLGMQAMATADAQRRRAALEEAEALLSNRCVSHNYFWFYRLAMETSLQSGTWDEVNRYARALEDYTRAEPLPWSDFYIARGRALAAYGSGDRGTSTMQEIERLRGDAERLGLRTALPALEDALNAVLLEGEPTGRCQE